MTRLIFLSFVIFLACIDVLYSADTTFSSPLVETVVIPIRLEKLYQDISPGDIRIYDGDRKKTDLPVALYKIDSENYMLVFYLYMGFSLGNYSILLENIKTISNSIVRSNNYTYNFFVEKTNSSLKVDPAVVFASESNTPFEVDVFAYSQLYATFNNTFIVQPNTQVLGDNVVLASIDAKRLQNNTHHTIEVLVKNVKSKYVGKLIVDIGEKKYEILVYSKDFDAGLTTPAANYNKKSLVFLNDKEMINLSLEFGQTVPGGGGDVVIKNDGNLSLDRINIGLSGNLDDIIELGNTTMANLGAGEQTSFFIYVNRNLSAILGVYEGNITVFYDTGEIYLPVYIQVMAKTLSETKNESVSKNVTYESNLTDENNASEQKNKNTLPLVILGLVLVLVIILSLFFIRKRKPKKEDDQKARFEEIISKYERV